MKFQAKPNWAMWFFRIEHSHATSANLLKWLAVFPIMGNQIPCCLSVYVWVCVYINPPWRLPLSGTSILLREQMSESVWKMWYFLPNPESSQLFQLPTLSSLLTRIGKSHYLTSICLAFKSQGLITLIGIGRGTSYIVSRSTSGVRHPWEEPESYWEGLQQIYAKKCKF